MMVRLLIALVILASTAGYLITQPDQAPRFNAQLCQDMTQQGIQPAECKR
jgi:hypothetical protein